MDLKKILNDFLIRFKNLVNYQEFEKALDELNEFFALPEAKKVAEAPAFGPIGNRSTWKSWKEWFGNLTVGDVQSEETKKIVIQGLSVLINKLEEAAEASQKPQPPKPEPKPAQTPPPAQPAAQPKPVQPPAQPKPVVAQPKPQPETPKPVQPPAPSPWRENIREFWSENSKTIGLIIVAVIVVTIIALLLFKGSGCGKKTTPVVKPVVVMNADSLKAVSDSLTNANKALVDSINTLNYPLWLKKLDSAKVAKGGMQ
jgi:hypothetical protein